MKQLKVLLFGSLFLAAVMAGCKKGDTGPAGATGATGPQGPQGPQGPAGTDSILHSSWTVLNMQQQIQGTDTFYTQIITASPITQAVLDSGLVLAYIGFPDQSGAITDVLNASEFVSSDYFLGSIQILANRDYSGASYRYVIIKGTVTTGNGARTYTKEELKKMTYKEVQQLFGLDASPSSN